MFDNRELAVRHTLRLNEFLRGVAARTHELGGEWLIDHGDTGSNAGLWVEETGVLLDREPPAKMPPEELDAEWY